MTGSHVFILGIIAMSLGYGLIKTWLKKRHVPAEGSNADGDEMLARIATLEERIRVLERIVTDGNHDLKREIDQL